MIFIQSNEERTRPHHFDVSCVLYGSLDLGISYKLVSFDDIQNGKYDLVIPRSLFVGSVEFMTKVFNRVKLPFPYLPRNSDRQSEITTIGDVIKRRNNGETMFIKPYQTKLFTGFVLDGMNYSILHSLHDNTMVRVYRPFHSPIQTEWRLYIHRDEIKDGHCYSGDFRVTPDWLYVQHIIEENKKLNFPISYTMDTGILEDQTPVTIEFNDMWGIGNYGMRNDWYVNLLRDRYNELMKEIP